jgi:hypothetical protein
VILGALMLALIGSADIARVALRPGSRRVPAVVVSIVLAWAVVLVLAAVGLGVSAWLLIPPVLVAVGWLVSTDPGAGGSGVGAGSGAARRGAVSRWRALPAVLVVALLVVSFFWDPVPEPSGVLVDALAGSSLGAVAALPVQTVVLAAGFAVFLVESANIVVRSALRPAMASSSSGAAASAALEAPAPSQPRRRWWWSGRQASASASVSVSAEAPVEDLKGGRIIGPLERLLIVGLALAGALPIVAGLFAAKGIVRFPEISQDGVGGSKAEYFLVGSLVSWSLALLAAGALWISAQG